MVHNPVRMALSQPMSIQANKYVTVNCFAYKVIIKNFSGTYNMKDF